MSFGTSDPRIPRTYKEAVALNSRCYYPHPEDEQCDRHGPNCIVHVTDDGKEIKGSQSYRFTKTRIWFCCANYDAVDAFNEAMKNGGATDARTAYSLGLDHYWRPERQKKCGHVGKMTLRGDCYICKHNPRQEAKAAGEKWYFDPNKTCSKGHVARRRVNNGACEQCEKESHDVREPTIQEMMPDLVISREAAKANGFKVYRTGEPCSRGHRGFRYISNNGCIECMVGK